MRAAPTAGTGTTNFASLSAGSVSFATNTVLGNYNVGNFTVVNVPNMNAFGTVNSLGGLAGAHQVGDLALTSNQFFNGFPLQALPALVPPLPPSTSTSTIGRVVGGQLRGLQNSGDAANGIGLADIGSGFEVSISAHNVDWDDAAGDLPIKAVDYLVDVEEYFSGKRGSRSEGSSGASSQGAGATGNTAASSPSGSTGTNPCVQGGPESGSANCAQTR